jgi:hypothetical protein
MVQGDPYAGDQQYGDNRSDSRNPPARMRQ